MKGFVMHWFEYRCALWECIFSRSMNVTNLDKCIVDNLVHTMHDVLATLYDILQAAHD